MTRHYHYQRRSRQRVNRALLWLVAMASAAAVVVMEVWRNRP